MNGPKLEGKIVLWGFVDFGGIAQIWNMLGIFTASE
jgi:hypothetical protein